MTEGKGRQKSSNTGNPSSFIGMWVGQEGMSSVKKDIQYYSGLFEKGGDWDPEEGMTWPRQHLC